MSLWKKIQASGAGEPGIYFSNDKDWGTNPCCFIGDTNIITDQGDKSIKEIVELVNSGGVCKVKTFNETTKQVEIKSVLAGQLTKENAIVVKLTVEENGIQYSVECTLDHQFYTNNRGWVECKDLTVEDDIVIYHSLV